MKKLFILLAIFTTVAATAQSVGINADGSVANASAILDLNSTTKGFLPPRMTYAEKTAISTPAAGLIVWCTNCGTNGEVQVYNGTSWVNMIGGDASTPAAQPPYTIGQAVLGGKVAYILQSGDSGYNANVQHGLIVATSDQSTSAQWGCQGTTITAIPQGTTIQTAGSAIGRGNQNTIDIMAECATAGIAARICGDLVAGGYSDWYLPSYYEFYEIFQNRASWGGFSNANYWTSTQDSNEVYVSYAIDAANRAVAIGGDYMGGGYGPTNKSTTYYVRAIRSF